jgi:hypothetical protein
VTRAGRVNVMNAYLYGHLTHKMTTGGGEGGVTVDVGVTPDTAP